MSEKPEDSIQFLDLELYLMIYLFLATRIYLLPFIIYPTPSIHASHPHIHPRLHALLHPHQLAWTPETNWLNWLPSLSLSTYQLIYPSIRPTSRTIPPFAPLSQVTHLHQLTQIKRGYPFYPSIYHISNIYPSVLDPWTSTLVLKP